MKELGFAPGFEPRLFQISNASGYIHMRELYNFQQDDLSNNDVMILDAGEEVGSTNFMIHSLHNEVHIRLDICYNSSKNKYEDRYLDVIIPASPLLQLILTQWLEQEEAQFVMWGQDTIARLPPTPSWLYLTPGLRMVNRIVCKHASDKNNLR